MKIMKFEGSNMREAVAKVKAELGDQAVIVSTRTIRRGLLGTACEISAAIDDDTSDSEPRFTRGFGALARAATEVPPALPNSDIDAALNPLRGEIKSLRALIRAAAADVRATNELRAEVASLRRLVEELRLPPPPTAPMMAKGTTSIATAPLTAPSTGRALMLVGPTGVGKTTTIAKLAARAALIEGKRVKLLTLDNYRVGGVDQIRTFAELIGVPLEVCANPRELGNMLDNNDDLTLIDTAGRSPRDTAAIRELADALRDTPEIETHLVIDASSNAMTIEDIANRYRAVHPARMLFTKVDEIDEAPELSRAPVRLGMPITWVTTGQAVPEDLEEPTTARVHELATAGLGGKTKRVNAA